MKEGEGTMFFLFDSLHILSMIMPFVYCVVPLILLVPFSRDYATLIQHALLIFCLQLSKLKTEMRMIVLFP